MSTPNAWDQLEGEPNRWYQRFCAFRLMGTGRSIEAIWRAEESGGKRPGKGWYQYSSTFQWLARAEAWDRHQTAQHEAAIEAEWQARIMGKAEVLARLSDIARGDIADLLDITPTGHTLKLLVDGPDGEKIVNPHTKLIKKFKQKVTTILSKTEDGEDREIIESEVELYPADDSLVDMGRHHAVFTDKKEITGADGGPLTWKQFIEGMGDTAE